MKPYQAQEKGFLEVTSVVDFVKSYAYPGEATLERAEKQLVN
jgi:hypothetical protein